MKKELKYFLCLSGCLVVFFIFIKIFGGALSSNSANAFDWEKQVNVYFVDLKKAKTSNCEADIAVPRMILNAETLGPGAIQALLRGLTRDEIKRHRYETFINPKTMLKKFEIINKIAYVDFSSDLIQGVAGSCTVTAIRSQIVKTVKSLPDIDSVVISVNGQTESVLQP
jgi:spore germination protein GerM